MLERKNFIDLTDNEIQLVLSWRNHPAIKQWMHTKKDISLEAHKRFIDSLQHAKDKDYFLVLNDHEYIGVVDLNHEFLGIYANPDKTRVGDLLLQAIISFAFEEKKLPLLKAEVYQDNDKAIKLYTRFGFQTTYQTDNLLTMELRNEIR